MVSTIFTSGNIGSLYQIGETFVTYKKLKLTQTVDVLFVLFDMFNTACNIFCINNYCFADFRLKSLIFILK